MRTLLIMVMLLLGSREAPAQQEEKYVTSGVGALCYSFTDVREGLKAFIAKDAEWLKSIGCFNIRKDVPVIKIEELNSSSDLHPWKVRITLPSGRGVSLWGPVFAFEKVAPQQN